MFFEVSAEIDWPSVVYSFIGFMSGVFIPSLFNWLREKKTFEQTEYQQAIKAYKELLDLSEKMYLDAKAENTILKGENLLLKRELGR